MARPQFTSPVERPADTASRETRVGSFSDESPDIDPGVSGACRPINAANDTISEDKLIDTITFAVSQNSPNYHTDLPAQVYVEDENFNTLHNFFAEIQSFPIQLDPAYVVPAGGEVRVAFLNFGGSVVSCKAGVTTRPK